MNRFIFKFLISLLLILNTFTTSFAQAPELNSSSAILIDMKNSTVMYEKNSSDKIQPAGFTKIVTALVVLENCNDLTEVIVADPEVIAACDFSFGNMGILSKEELSVENLLNGMLLYDAAEAAELLAGYTFGNYDKFIASMNQTAKNAGAENTVFKNAGGYYHDEQVSTVADIARIAQSAMNNTKFAEIVKKDMAVIEPTNKYKQTRYLSNTNMFVGRNRSLDFYSKKVNGIKTSYMKGHGYGICISYTNSRGEFLCVTSGASNAEAAHTDAQSLRQFSVDGFTSVTIADKEDIIEEVAVPNGKTSHVLLKTADDLTIQLPLDYDQSKIFKMVTKDNDISAPIEKDQVLGKLSVSYDGSEIGSVDLIAYSQISFSPGKSVRLIVFSVIFSPFFYLPLIALLIISVYLIYRANIKKLKSNLKDHRK